MTIRNHADVRRCMTYIHGQRRKTGDQQYMRPAEDFIATEPRCVDWELQAIERATELDAPSFLDDWARQIIERSEGE